MNLSRNDCVFGIVPRYAALSLLLALAWNGVIYQGAIWLRRGSQMWDMTSPLEQGIPFQPAWIVVYFGCYLFWVANYILIARRGEEEWFRFLWADLCAELVCGLFFVLMPTTNVRPEIQGAGLAGQLVALLYQIDPPQNLFPSIHCLVSWFCFIGVRSDRRIPLLYRSFSCLFALAVCASTLFIKQHCVPDVLSGVLLAELTYAVARHTAVYRPLRRLLRPRRAQPDG